MRGLEEAEQLQICSVVLRQFREEPMRRMFGKISTQPLDRLLAYFWLGVVMLFVASMIMELPVSKSDVQRWAAGQDSTAIASVQP